MMEDFYGIGKETFNKLMKEYLMTDDSRLTKEALNEGINHILAQEDVELNAHKQKELIAKLKKAAHESGMGATGEMIH